MGTRDDSATNRRLDIQRRFDRAAQRFDSADFVHSVTRRGLLARLEPMVVAPQTVIDLGAATGAGSQLLSRRFRRAQIIAVDLSLQMLERTPRRRGWRSRTSAVQADAAALPFADRSIDLVFANLLLPWIDEPAPVLQEVSRVTREGALFLFASLGPDSFTELRDAWSDVDVPGRVPRFPDMHDVGDALIRAGFRDPVLDVDRLAITYRSALSLFRDLAAIGASGSEPPDRIGRLRELLQLLDSRREEGLLKLELELVYGHCWGGSASSSAGEHSFPVSQIGRRER